MYYTEITSTRFNEEIYLKREFRSNEIKEMDLEQNSKNNKKIKDFELDPHQIFLKNYISPDTPYNGILIFHGTGVGKTCSAISIAEGFKKTLKNINKKVLILSNLRDNFKKEIYDICRQMVELEDKFLDLVFEMGNIQGLTKEDMYKYNRYIADRRLLQLGLKTNYNQKENPLTWLDEVMGVEHQNFFEGRATSYMKAGLRGRQDKVTFSNLENINE